jgi:hypothetical protein
MNTSVSSASASSTASGSLPANASDGSTSTIWKSNPISSTTTTEAAVNLTEIKRTSSTVTYYTTTKSNLGVITEVDIDGITTLSTTTLDIWRYVSGITRYAALRYSSGTNPPFYANDTVNISGVPTGMTGSKEITQRKFDSGTGRYAIEIRYGSNVEDSNWVPDSGTVTGTTSNGNQVSNLNTVGFKTVSSYSSTSVDVAASNVGFTPTFDLAGVNGTMTRRGRAFKGSGTETLTLNFSPIATRANPRMLGGSDGIRITNDSAGTITFSIERALQDGSWTEFKTDVSLAANDTQTYHFDGIMLPALVFGSNFFSFRITANRVNSGSEWFASFKEVLIQYRYDE